MSNLKEEIYWDGCYINSREFHKSLPKVIFGETELSYYMFNTKILAFTGLLITLKYCLTKISNGKE